MRTYTMEIRRIRNELEFIAQGCNTATDALSLCRTYEQRARLVCKMLDGILENIKNNTCDDLI